MARLNAVLNVDSYKISQWTQYPPGTEGIFSYIEARKGYESIVFFGLQAFIKEYLLEPITQEMIYEAEELLTAHGEPFNVEGWQYIVDVHNGRLPISIKAVPEGTPVSPQNVLLTIENTDPKCFWLTSYLETALLRAIWYPSTVATNSRKIKGLIAEYLDKTGDPTGLPFKLHDFGARGSQSEETAALGGMAHLVNFMGTDTISALVGARRFYHDNCAGFSIPASEHSSITSWGKDREVEAYRNMIKQFSKPGSIYACVSDSYDIFNAVDKIWGQELKAEVIAAGGTLVVRPDSGVPHEVVLRVAQLLDKNFGSTINEKGYKVLNHVRIIQGDGIFYENIGKILFALKNAGYSADNIAFGMGGALLGKPQRDDFGWAMKCSAAKINGEWVDVFKDPVTDPGKKSKKGRLALVKRDGIYKTVREEELIRGAHGSEANLLREVYRNGHLLISDTFTAIRERAAL